MKLDITNEKIYDKICDVEKHVIKTNGRVTLNRWIATTAITLTIILIGIILGPVVSAVPFFGMIIGGKV